MKGSSWMVDPMAAYNPFHAILAIAKAIAKTLY
jgi:hypothetical protein